MLARRARRSATVAATLPAMLLAAGPSSAEEVALELIDVAGNRSREAAAPGLNLATPSRSGSRLGLTPLETPASLDIIAGETIRARGQNTVEEAVTQNAVGITSIAAPGNGNLAFTARGFAGPSSVQQLYDGTRLYVGAGTVTFPFISEGARDFYGCDPEDLMLFSQTIPLSRLGVYSVGFFFFWFFAALSSAITCMLSRPGSELNAARRAADSDHEPPPGQAAGNH